jgi:two-component sensor histidine kinase
MEVATALILPSLDIGHRLRHMETPAEEENRRVRPLFQVLAGATALGLLTVAWMTTIGRIQGEDLSFVDEAAYVLPFWYLWALYTLPVAWLAKHRPFERGVLISRSATHLCAALLLSFAHTSIRVGTPMLFGVGAYPGAQQLSPVLTLLGLATLEAPIHLFIYFAIMGVTYIVSYRRRLRERERATARLSEQLALAQVQALRMQINPHFLFNAMNSISMLVRDRRHEEAVKTIAGLSDLLRYVLDESSEQEIPLRQELDFILRYLAIEQIRFPDRLQVAIEVEDDVLDALVPNLVLQPIVENAIRHGVSRSATTTTITISAEADGDKLELDVYDDGSGFADQPPEDVTEGLGVANTRERLRQLYGPTSSFQLDNRAPRGAAVSISIPLHTSPILYGQSGQ